MKKSHPFNILSNVTCSIMGCHRRLKKRIVEHHPSHKVCYKHFKILKRKGWSTRRAKSATYIGR